MLTLSDGDFNRLYTYIQQHYGINLSHKKQLITSRLTNMLQQKGFHSFTEYIDEIISGKDPEMVSVMLNKLTTNYTYFMREKEHFDFLQKQILPELANKHSRDRSIAKEYFSALPGSWDTRILATDISQRVLDSAMDPRYSLESLKELPPSWQERYFVPMGDKTYTVSDALRKNVIFRSFNLMDPIHFRKKFDLIFCRNVMIYFDRPTKAALVRRFYDATAPGGYLFIGHSESLDKESCPFSYIEPAIYRKI